MFFAPPQVKSLSRYSEFGIYLDYKYFLVMLGIAFAIHLGIIGIYAMMPQQEVVRIPVRVLNIKLNGGVGIAMPVKTVAPLVVGEPAVKADNKPAAANVHPRKQIAHHSSKPVVVADNAVPAQAEEKDKQTASAENNLDTPKQYVRESEMGATGSQDGSGSASGNAKSSEEIMQRYEQTLSYWVSQHKIYPEEARRQGIGGDAIVRVRINRQGHILESEIERSSGNALIDGAIMSMVRSSDPAPRMPDNYPEGNEFEYLIPVSFHLQ